MRCKYLKKHRKGEYIELLINGNLNEHLHGVDNECYERMELLIDQMKTRAGIMEKLKAADQIKWVGLMNNVRNVAEKIILKEVVYWLIRVE